MSSHPPEILVKWEGSKPGRGPRRRTKSAGRSNGHPFATTEFSRTASAKMSSRTESCRTLTWPAQKEATRRRSHLTKDGYRCAGVPQLRLEIDSQRPTIHRTPRMRDRSKRADTASDVPTAPNRRVLTTANEQGGGV